MTKRSITFISLFSIFLILFIALILIGEYKNMAVLRAQGSLIPITHKMINYRKTNLIIWAINLILTFLIPGALLYFGLSAKLMKFLENTFKNRFLIIATFALVYLLVNFIIRLPLRYYSSFIISHRYGISNQTFARWSSNIMKNLAIDLIVWMSLLWFPYWLIHKYKYRWWLYLGLLALPVLVFATYITPTFIDPLFNEYIPIQDPHLDSRIRETLKKAGIEDSSIYQVNKSIDTKNMNAYMTGTLKAKRIVLWDNTIENLTEDEVISILSHEIGHYVKGHIWKSIIAGSILIIGILFLINKICLWLLKSSQDLFGFKSLHQIASLPLIILVLNMLMFFSSPLINGYSRYHEREADVIELELTQEPEVFISGLTKLYKQSLSLPRISTLYKLWYNSHPTYEERVRMAKDYEDLRR
mgnify:FL=1